MVNNINKILDEGVIKIIMSKEYKIMIQDYSHMCRCKSYKTFGKDVWNERTSTMEYHEVPNENYKEMPQRIRYAVEQVEEEMKWGGTIQKYMNARLFYHAGGEQIILDYLEIIPFTPSVMINISPNWGIAKDKMSDKTKAKRLESVINDYMKIDSRYDYYSYVIECGSSGNHIHAHIVAHVNPKLVKSVVRGKNSHIGKGCRLPGALNTQGGKRGIKGVFSGKGISTTILNCQELVNDKLDYLTEEKKPEGHKNKYLITGRVDVVLFTVK